MPILGNFPGGGTAATGLQLYPATGVQTIAAGERAYIKWTDPNDIVADGNVLAEWDGTVLVRKAGSVPISRRDGVIILDSKTRNAYKDTYFCDNGLTNGVQYFYRIFPYTKDGAYTDDEDSYTVTPSPVKVGSVIPGSVSPAGYGKVSVSWEDPEPYTIIDGVTVAEWETTYVTLRKGAIPCTSLDQIDVDTNIIWYNTASRNTFKDTPLVIDGLDNGSAYAVSFFAVTTEGVWSASKTTYPFLGVTPNRIQIEKPTLVADELTYTGETQRLAFSSAEPAVLNKLEFYGGDNSAQNAGQYTASFIPQNDYMWEDGTRSTIAVQWSIQKAACSACASATLYDASFELVSSKENVDEIQFDNGCQIAEIHVQANTSPSAWSLGDLPSNMAEITVDYDNAPNYATIEAFGHGEGSYFLTVTIPESDNYLGTELTISLTFDYANIYGAEWLGTSLSKWNRTDASSDFIDPTPAISTGTGSSPFDSIMPWSGMIRVTDPDAGELVEIPKFWFRWTSSGGKLKLQIADKAVAGFHVSPAHADRGDGSGERDKVYVGRYNCDSNYQSSPSTQPLLGVSRADARDGIHTIGSSIWQYDLTMYWTIRMLYLVEYADWDGRKAIGLGRKHPSGYSNTGYTDSMIYHTGTSLSSRDEIGSGIQYRNIEGLWGDVNNHIDGIRFSGKNIYCIKNPADFSDTTGGVKTGERGTSSGGYISGYSIPSIDGFEYAVYPSELSGGATTYVHAYCVNQSGGLFGVALSCYEPFSLDGSRQISNGTKSADGCRLMKLP